MYANRRPSSLQQDLDVDIAQSSELVDKANPREELREPGDSFFDTGHADEHHAETALIKDGTELFHAIHCQTIGFIDDDESRRVWDRLDPGLVLVKRVVVCRLEGQRMVGPVISVFAMFNTPSLVAVAQNVKPCPLFCASRSLGDAADQRASLPDVILDSSWRVHDFRSHEHRVDWLGIRSLRIPAAKGTIF